MIPLILILLISIGGFVWYKKQKSKVISTTVLETAGDENVNNETYLNLLKENEEENLDADKTAFDEELKKMAGDN